MIIKTSKPTHLKIFVRTYDNAIYIADNDDTPANKKTWETGKNWSQRTGKPGREFIVENKDISINIEDSAFNSSQGGDVSFWMCGITFPGDNTKYKAGIKSERLCEMLKSTDLNKGVFNVKFYMMKSGQEIIPMHKSMSYYKTMVSRYETYNNSLTRSKTTAFKCGHLYSNSSGTYMYNVGSPNSWLPCYNDIIFAYVNEYKYHNILTSIKAIKFLEKPKKINLMKTFYYKYDKTALDNKTFEEIFLDALTNCRNKHKYSPLYYEKEGPIADYKVFNRSEYLQFLCDNFENIDLFENNIEILFYTFVSGEKPYFDDYHKKILIEKLQNKKNSILPGDNRLHCEIVRLINECADKYPAPIK